MIYAEQSTYIGDLLMIVKFRCSNLASCLRGVPSSYCLTHSHAEVTMSVCSLNLKRSSDLANMTNGTSPRFMKTLYMISQPRFDWLLLWGCVCMRGI